MSNLEKNCANRISNFLFIRILGPKKTPKNHVVRPKIRKNQKLEISFPQFFSKLLIDLTFQISRFYLHKQKSLRVFSVSEIQGFY